MKKMLIQNITLEYFLNHTKITVVRGLSPILIGFCFSGTDTKVNDLFTLAYN